MDAASAIDPSRDKVWPALPLDAWTDTYATLHMWTQIAGKIRLTLAPPVNHWWHCALHLSASGLTTTAIPYQDRLFEIEFDFIEQLNAHQRQGYKVVATGALSVATLSGTMSTLKSCELI